ncbi:winged helix-turn-helix domain-containing protein [Egicoccus sp. AB-alg2]|uniref:winged helix-turn-helix domain-containing protein n=1 Tax=Egicoccus sp. AB-alg2 TaxID=3242693 RepID=UPI00359D0EB9
MTDQKTIGEERPVWPPADDRVLDAAALKALAHPVRFQLVELLGEHGPSTASALGRMIGENSGSTSYHLRQLAAQGLIEEATELGSKRDRYWRLVRGGWTLEGFELLEREDTRDDALMVLDEVLRARFNSLRRWHRDGKRWGDDWVESTIEMTGRFRLTRDELRDMRDELVAVIDRYRDLQADRRERPGAEPSDVVPVRVQVDAYPTGDPPDDADGGAAAEAASDDAP